MFVLGLILILLSAGSLIAVLSSGTGDQASLYGGSVQLPTLVIFLAGAAALLIFIMGLELVRSGVRRANENRKAKKRLRKLEKREELRRDEPAGPTPGTAKGTTTTPGAATGSATGSAEADPAHQPTTPTPTGEPRGTTGGPTDGSAGPYQTPPPPGR